jgi:hypothetical protein
MTVTAVLAYATLGDVTQNRTNALRGNQLPVSAAIWQHWSQIYLLLLFSEKLQNC